MQSALIIFLAFGAYSALHSVLASLSAKQWAREAFGSLTIDRFYRLFFNFVGTVTLLPVLWLAAVLPDRHLYTVPFPWMMLTSAGQLFGIVLLLASLQQTGTSDFLGIKQALQGPALRPPELKTDGYYARMRHPLYTGSLLVLWLLPAMSVNILTLVIAASLYFWVGAIFEERKLERFFGDAYLNYKTRTPMFLPLPKR